MLNTPESHAPSRSQDEFPRSLSENQPKFDEFVQGYEPGAVVTAGVITLVLTAIGHLVTYLVAGKEGIPRAGFAVCWALALAVFPLLFATRRAILRSPVRRVPPIYWVQSAVQLTWLALLAWYASPAFVPVLFFVLCLLLFNDVRYLYSAPALTASYLSMWPSQLVVLLAIDAAGGEGLLGAFRLAPQRTAVVLVLEACVALLSLIIIRVVGKNHYERDSIFFQSARLQAALESMKTERQVIARSCDFLLHGLSATRFSHDVASPLSVLTLEVERLREMLSRGGADALDPALGRCLGRIEEAAFRAENLTRSLARSLREPSDPLEVPVLALIAESARHAERALSRHAVTMRSPKVQGDDVAVTVSPDHASALGNVMVNGILQNQDDVLEIEARPLSEYFCKLSIRDFGVAPEARPAALARVEAQMSLHARTEQAAREEDYDGYGIGLLLTKALVVRWGGWMAVREPEAGPGLCFDIVLPRLAPQHIPENLNYPEKLLQ